MSCCLEIFSAERHTSPHGIGRSPTIHFLQEFFLRKLALVALVCLFTMVALGLAEKSAEACSFRPLAQAPAAASPSDMQTPPNSTASDVQSAAHVTAYTLPPDKYAQARGLAGIGYVAGILIPLYSILVLYLMLRWGWSAKFRDWAEARTAQPFYQSGIYCTAFFSVYTLSRLPIRAWFHWLYVKNDLVVQGWPSWLGDSAKQFTITVFVGTILVTALFSTVRRSPRRWWIQFWLGMLPFIVLIIFLTPLVIDPLFNKFEPLSAHDPQLVSDLERVVKRGGLEIRPQRMFLMKARKFGMRSSLACECMIVERLKLCWWRLRPQFAVGWRPRRFGSRHNVRG